MMLSAADIERWLALYAATGVCCAIAMALSVGRVVIETRREQILETTRGWKAWAWLVPRLWWRWQKAYLTSTPVTLAIVGAFAFSMDWGT